MRLLFVLAILVAAPALAAPRVVTDIAPVHSIAAQVMEGVGEPDLLVRVGASPHGYSLRPSEAQALQDADIVFWVGEELTPWLERGIASLAADASVVELLGADGSTLLPGRDAAIFAHDDDHDEDHDKHGDHGHEDGHDEDEHEDHAHGDADHKEHAEDAHGHDHHDHDGADPHAWLDPDNAKAWADLIAAALTQADPANAAAYAANATAAKARIDATAASVAARLEPVRGKQFVVFHDAYQYFETRFAMPSAGAISLSDARKPSPARIAAIRDHVRANDISCVFAEPQFNPGVVSAVSEGAGVRSGVMDPLGAAHKPGPAFYSALLDDLGTTMVDCLSE